MTAPDPNTHAGFLELIRMSDHRARCYVQGSAYHDRLKSIQPIAGGWSSTFAKHPRVVEAEAEGWGKELRSSIIAECKRRMIAGEDVSNIDDLMPNRKRWWEGTRDRAKQYRLAEAYQNRQLSPNGAAVDGVLSDLSRRITGEANSGG